MKNSLFKFGLIAIIGTIATLAGCQTASMLSKKIEGDWTGTPVRFSKKTDINGEFTPTFHFSRGGNSNGGSMTLSAALSVMMPVNAPIDSMGITPVSATAAGMATVRGTWIATDDDEIDLHFDYSTLVINMDPDVEFEFADIWSANDTPSTRTVPEAAKKAFVKQMTEGMTHALSKLDDLDDIKIKDNVMTCKFLKQKQTLNRVFD